MLELRLTYDANKPPFSFFTLPRELRNMIYSLILEADPDISFVLPKLHDAENDPSTGDQTSRILAFTDQLSRTHRNNTDFVLTSERIYNEAVDIHREIWSPSRSFPDPGSICGQDSVEQLQMQIDRYAIHRIWPLKVPTSICACIVHGVIGVQDDHTSTQRLS
ncbi:hypothetical protein K431DRAFT_300393 [Polychaeton citri CBS 116435]|uniref:Uncharacterized protein n=1 Tax=Polychaeton citri CBS 116435 TaxID=1314669 RepID=A0A9P4QHI0_9PEZI|nr:hypothetical protein K431DRAFT_300393 [Polychaeton citri CBS 116435]